MCANVWRLKQLWSPLLDTYRIHTRNISGEARAASNYNNNPPATGWSTNTGYRKRDREDEEHNSDGNERKKEKEEHKKGHPH